MVLALTHLLQAASEQQVSAEVRGAGSSIEAHRAGEA
jgi:hypothetical protein